MTKNTPNYKKSIGPFSVFTLTKGVPKPKFPTVISDPKINFSKPVILKKATTSTLKPKVVKKGGRKSRRRTPSRSPRKSPSRSHRKSHSRSPRKSPRKSHSRSPRKSPRK